MPYEELIVALVHTHPPKYGEGIAFSPDDVSSMRTSVNSEIHADNPTIFVEAGTKRFALVVVNQDLADKFFKENSLLDLNKKFRDATKKATGNWANRTLTGNKAMISSDSGLALYGTTDKKKESFQFISGTQTEQK